LHVYLYSVHHLMQGLSNTEAKNISEDGMIKLGQITTPIIKMVAPIALRELYGDLMFDKTADTKKKHIKESKCRKAMSIFEQFASWCDFEVSFIDLI